MRRQIIASLTLGMLSTVLGCCHHMAGVCDCQSGYGCAYNYGGCNAPVTIVAPVAAAPAAQPEQLKAMPKTDAQPAPEAPKPGL